jgi:multidrug efflux pump subunit AcrA (membrane-fusion protein)
MKKFVAIFLVLFVAAGGVFLLKKRKADLAQAAPASVLPAVVATTVLKTSRVTLTLPAMGIVASEVSAVLSTKVSGQVIAVYKQEGNSVKKGDVLARIDVRELEAKKHGLTLQRQEIAFQVDSKKADVKALEISLTTSVESHARTEELLKVKGASIEEFSEEQAKIAKIRAGLSAARNSIETLLKGGEALGASIREIESLMDYATVISPIDGTVSQSLAKPGDLATPGSPLFRVASRAGLYLTLSLPDTLQPSEILFDGQALRLTSKHQAGETGLVQYVAPLPAGQNIAEGQYVNVFVVVYKGEDVLAPVDALLTMDGVSSVFVLAPDGKAQRLRVHIKARGVEGVTVTENLGGRTVIVAKPDILLRVAAGVPVAQIKG